MSNNNTLPTLNGDLYNYELAMSADIAQWVEDAGGIVELMEDNTLSDSDELAEYLNDELFVSDSVTGNGSGSYWFSRYNAQLALIGNMDLLGDAITEFEADVKKCLDPESADVTIRCYLLGSAVAEYVSTHEDEIEKAADFIERKANNELTKAEEDELEYKRKMNLR